MRRRDPVPWGARLALAGGLWLVIASLVPTSEVGARRVPCTPTTIVDGTLVCQKTAVDRCGTTQRLRAGDVFDTTSCAPPSRMPPAELAALQISIDPNCDDASDLESLPGIGPALARRIEQGRPYADVDALLSVKGIGPRTLAAIEPRLVLTHARPCGLRSRRQSSASPQ